MSENILNANPVEGYEFSEHQKNFWKIAHAAPGRFYHEVLLKILTSFTEADIRNAITAVLQQHEVLRFRVHDNGKYAYPIQYPGAAPDIVTIEDGDTNLRAAVKACLDRTYDPSVDAPVRFCLVKQDDKIIYLGCRLYALWSDAFSCTFLVHELLRALKAGGDYLSGDTSEQIDYAKFSAWQNDMIQSPEEEATFFWSQYESYPFDNVIPFATVSAPNADIERKVVHTIAGAQYNLLVTFCSKYDVTLEDALLAGFAQYLGAFTGQPVTIGYLSQARRYDELNDTMGLVNGIIPLQLEPKPGTAASAYVSYVKSERDRVKDWADYYTLNRDGATQPDRTMFGQVFEFLDTNITGNDFSLEDLYTLQEPVALKLSCMAGAKEVRIELYVQASAFTTEAMHVLEAQLGLFFGNINNLVDTALIHGWQLSAIETDIITAAHTDPGYNIPETNVVALFEQQAVRRPDAVALVGDGLQMTYAALDQQANALKHYLINQCGVQAGAAVCYLGNASSWFVTAVLGIMKAGAFYIPIDQNYPAERIRHIVEDSGCRILVCEPGTDAPDLPGLRIIYADAATLLQDDVVSAAVAVSGTDLAYCIFTSGSTGKPKGCAISHGALGNYIGWANGFYFPDEATGNWALISSISFDLTVTALFTSLTRGKQLRIGKAGADMETLLRDALAHGDVDTLKLTPSHITLMAELGIEQAALKTVICGGEQLLQHHIDTLFALHADMAVYNEYGPTEATVGCVVKQVASNGDRIVIGQPIAHTRILVVAEDGKACPVGITGEMYIGGRGLAQGYLNRPELTATSFIADPDCPGERLYRTGDLARWLPDGDIECLGRKDGQLKIRGYRIEPEDIASQLLLHTDIDQAVVLGKELEPGRKEIVAYFVSPVKPDSLALATFLEDKLPAYMLPAFYVQVPAMPLTPNGKTDQQALLAIKIAGADNDRAYVAPRNALEEEVCRIWEQVLAKEQVGINDNFFNLGGHSLKATRLINEYQKCFGVRLSLKAIFEQVTPAAHALLIRTETGDALQAIKPAPLADSYPLSSAQKRIWVLSQFKEASPAYNIPASIYLADCDVTLLKRAVDSVIDRHEMLRTVFKEDQDGMLRQWIIDRETLGFVIPTRDYRNHRDSHEAIAAAIQEDSFQPFDLENGPLVRAELFRITDSDYVLYYNMHHIISDGWSMHVMEKDVMAFYAAFKEEVIQPPAALTLQYKDYAYWEQSAVRQEALSSEKAYWMGVLASELPVCELPQKAIRPKVKTYNGRYLYTYLAPSCIQDGQAFVATQGGSMFMLLLTTWNILLYKYTRSRDAIVGTPVAGRDHAELEQQIGFYVNTLALRNRLDPEATVKEFYDTVVHNTLSAFTHQAYPFDQLVQDLDLVRDTSRDPVFNILFALQNNEDLQANHVAETAITGEIRDNGAHPAKFELAVNFKETAAGLYFNITYNEDVYELAFVERLMTHFGQLLHKVMANPALSIKALDFLDAGDHALLASFNAPLAPVTEHTLVSLFKEQVAKNPAATALVYEQQTMTYAELEQAAGNLAGILQQDYKIRKGDLVGVQLERNQWAVVAFLGVMMAGGVYIPVDKGLPEQRKTFIVEDTGMQLFITDGSPGEHAFYTGNTFYLDDRFKLAPKDGMPQYGLPEPRDLAYIIYTSGTTGQPKGVMIEHVGVVNTMLSHITRIDMAAYRSCLQFSSFAFDAAVAEVFGALLSGAALHILSDYRRNDVALFEQYIAEHAIDVALITPAYLKLLNPGSLSGLKVLITAGEAAVADKVAAYLPYGIFYNAYGPTEASICATIYKIDKGSALEQVQIPIGYPITNAAVYILDEYGQLMPPGALGEIVIGGAGVARGYLNRPDLNEEKFALNRLGMPGRIYRTGDLGRWLPDGSLAYAGRLDSQVKIRGHRVELQEIEHRLQLHPQVREAVVLAENGELFAFIAGEDLPAIAALRTFLETTLPDYMIPALYYEIETIPLTVNGKADRQALLGTTHLQLQSGSRYEAPATELEEALVRIWEQVLDRAPIGVLDNFFHTGGDSIKGIRIFTEIQKAFSVKLDLSVIFQKHTIRELAHYISERTLLSDIVSPGQDAEIVDQVVI